MDTKQNIISQIEGLKGNIAMFADGFIDEVWELVDTRSSIEKFTLVDKMTGFADRIKEVGTGGMGIEITKKRRAFGGFTCNIGCAAASLGVDTVMAGIYGKGELDPIFKPLEDISQVISLGDPATTHVLEFDDGKILMTDMQAMFDMTWDYMVNAIGKEALVALLAKADMIGLGYWSLMPAFDEIMTEMCAAIPEDGKTRRFFFDFADVRKRDEASLVATLANLSQLNSRFPMTLSVNEHEALVIFGLHGQTFDDEGMPLAEKTAYVREKIGLEELVIHTPRYAIAATRTEGAIQIPHRFCEKPVRTAGAGDTFNGGYIAATLAGLGIEERLYTANAAVSFFLNNGFAPTRQNLIETI